MKGYRVMIIAKVMRAVAAVSLVIRDTLANKEELLDVRRAVFVDKLGS
jgi:hypothetical protein